LAPGHGGDGREDARELVGTDLERQARNALRDKAPGVVVVVVGPEGVRARTAVGIADLISDVPMTTGAAMPWFSMTKIVTATTAMRLSERGILDLDAPIHPYVPAVGSLRPGELGPAHHAPPSAPTRRWTPESDPGQVDPPAEEAGPELDPLLDRLLQKHWKLRFEPGTKSSYSNLGTLTLGAAIARLTGSRFETVVRDEVLGPVGMSSTGFTYPSDTPGATGYHPRWSPMRFLLPRWVIGDSSGRWVGLRPFLLDGAPYGGLVGTPDDAARFLQMHLHDGELIGVRVISTDAATAMRRIDLPGRQYDLGMGWFRPADGRSADPPFVEHLGGGAGFYNVVRLYPTVGVGAVVMGNATKYDVDAIASLALDFRS
jgi:CubicO group peptidase (beta-lactamase class C family)